MEKALAVAWLALEGGRLIEGRGEDAEPFKESAAPLIREVRALNKELAELDVVPEGESVADELKRKRGERIAAGASSSRRSQPRRSGRGG